MLIQIKLEVRKLEVGEIVKTTDFYLSTSGTWEQVSITNLSLTDSFAAGHEVTDNGVQWVRSTTDE
jgi:hypothetical protein